MIRNFTKENMITQAIQTPNFSNLKMNKGVTNHARKLKENKSYDANVIHS